MTATSLLTDGQRALRAAEQAREATRAALEAVVDGADFNDADALIDQLNDLGYRVTPIEGRR